MKIYKMATLAIAGIGLGLLGRELTHDYLDNKLKKVGCYPAPDGASVLDKMELVARSPYNPKRFRA